MSIFLVSRSLQISFHGATAAQPHKHKKTSEKTVK